MTLTTVGYGDISPVTPLGKFIASIIMIIGYGVIAIPTGIFTAELARTKGKIVRQCKHCGNVQHDPDAKYCKNCGKSLDIPSLPN